MLANRAAQFLGSLLQALATDGPRARAAIGATPATTIGCALLILLVLAVLAVGSRVQQLWTETRRRQHTVVNTEPPLFVDDDLPALQPSELGAAIAALKQHAREHALLEAGALLRQVRRAIETSPSTPASIAARAALEGEVSPGLTSDELARLHAECLHTLQLLEPAAAATGWRELSSHGGHNCYVRRAADGAVWAKATSELRGVRLADLVAIFRSTDLFALWYPRCVASENLRLPSAVERLFRMVVELRIPLLGAISYDLIPHAYGVDALEARGAMLMCGGSARPEEWHDSASWPPPPKGGFRQELPTSPLHLAISRLYLAYVSPVSALISLASGRSSTPCG